MKIIQLTDELHEYLLHVLKRHSGMGVDPTEGMAVFQLWDSVTKAVHIDPNQLKKAQAAVADDKAGQTPTELPEPHNIPDAYKHSAEYRDA
jgi:hypothetical protein